MTDKISTKLNTNKNGVSAERLCNGLAVTKICRVVFVILTLSLCLLLLTSCFLFRGFEYTGEYPELWSVTIGTIPSEAGAGMGTGGFNPQPFIIIIEIDNYGRVLFSYGNGFLPFFRVIMQRTDNNYAYFYTHYNHMADPRIDTGFLAAREQRYLYDEMIENLKIANNWNQPMSDDSEFDRVRIVRRRERGPVPEDILREAFHELLIFAERDSIPSWDSGRMRFLREDRYGRTIYVHGWLYQFWVTILQPDHSFDIDISFGELIGHDYQTDLRLLMEANGWNTPP